MNRRGRTAQTTVDGGSGAAPAAGSADVSAAAGAPTEDVTALLHPAVAAWFTRSHAAPTPCQQAAWPRLKQRENLLIAAPTGSGKTLAAFLAAIDDLVVEGIATGLPAQTRVLYVSPLRALGNDIQKNLQQPLMGIRDELFLAGHADVDIRSAVRTGDTPAAARAAMRRKPPHILVTTPESLYILLTSESGRAALTQVRTVIVDEIHALADNKRGAHLMLSLERLEQLALTPPVRVGLSATVAPLARVAAFLVGQCAGVARACRTVSLGHARERDLALELPPSPLAAVMSHEQWSEIYDRLAELVCAHRTTLVFVNTRRLVERLAMHLSQRLGESAVGTHHGSLSREQRLAAEERLKTGALRVLVATRSLELGIDIGEVDLVCQVGATNAIASFLQRAGRAGRRLDRVTRARLFPLSRDQLVEAAALLDAVRRGEIDALEIPAQPLDVLAQQIVAAVACEPWQEAALYDCLRRADPYRALTRGDFDAVVRMLAEGYTLRRGRSGAWLFRDAVNGRLRARRGARLAAVTCGGAIPDNALYEVRQEPTGLLVGTLDEDFAIESTVGDIFQLGNTSWRVLKVESGTVRVEDAGGQPPSIPFWFGEAPARTIELSAALSRLRGEIEARLFPGGGASLDAADVAAARRWLEHDLQLPASAAAQILDYLLGARLALGALPTLDTLVMERFFDASGGQQLIIHSVFGARVNRAWGLALRKRFCRSFNFELQSAATEDAIILSLGETHSFVLDTVWRYLQPDIVRALLVQAVLDAPMFATRFRWNAVCALAIARRRGGRKVPPRLLRMQAEDLIAVVFPEQRACLENISGDREVPAHPLVQQTLQDCLTEAMAIDPLERLLADVTAGRKRLIARDLTEPSPLAAEILAARPYAFLDDAPLEERRTLAVQTRRHLAPERAADLGRLDPEAIERVRAEAWPDAANEDELHDALLSAGVLAEAELTAPFAAAAAPWLPLLATLAAGGRAVLCRIARTGTGLWCATERVPELCAAVELAGAPDVAVPDEFASRSWSRGEALGALLRSRLAVLGPTTATALAAPFGLAAAELAAVLAALEAEGYALRGRWSPGLPEDEWCERRLLARIHRQTTQRLRREIEPVAAAEFLRHLVAWQGLTGLVRDGPRALESALGRLEGFEAQADAVERELLPARVHGYAPDQLDALCRAGRVAWLRLRSGTVGARAAPVRNTPVALLPRSSLADWLEVDAAARTGLGQEAAALAQCLERHGACFAADLARLAALLPTEVDLGLAELVVRGLVTSDSYAGLRALIAPVARRGRGATARIDDAGRWSLLAAHGVEGADRAASIMVIARAVLSRYGVVFRRLVEREPALPPWRLLLVAFRRLEARGEIRGGRFVAGFAGEQYALPEAVTALRELRRAGPTSAPAFLTINACDPLNLAGLIVPGPRVPAVAGNRLLLQDGVPVAALVAGDVIALAALGPEAGAELRQLSTAPSAGVAHGLASGHPQRRPQREPRRRFWR